MWMQMLSSQSVGIVRRQGCRDTQFQSRDSSACLYENHEHIQCIYTCTCDLKVALFHFQEIVVCLCVCMCECVSESE